MYKALCILSLIGILTACKKNTKTNGLEPGTGLKLDYIEVAEKGYGATLYLYGSFGEEAADKTVKVKGASVNKIVQWCPALIICEVGGSDAPNASGEVIVSANGKKSNGRILNQWDGKLTFIRPSGGTLEEKVVFDIHLRADVAAHPSLPYRIDPNSSVTFNSRAQWSIGGQGTSTYNDGCSNTMTANWVPASGSVISSEPGDDRSTEDEDFQALVKFSDLGFHVEEFLFHKFKATKTTLSGVSCGNPWTNNPEDIGLHNFPSNFEKFVLTFKGNTSTIKSDSLVLTNQENSAGLLYNATDISRFHTVKLRWDEIPAKF